MPRSSLRLPLFVAALLACVAQPRAQVVNLTPHCDEFGVLAWGKFSTGTTPPAVLKSSCDGTVPLPAISNAPSGTANQVAAFSTGRAVAINRSVNWGGANPLAVKFDPAEQVAVKVWVLYTKSTCDFACVKIKMANFLVWANDRLSAERTGLQLIAADGGVDWVSNQTALGATAPVSDLLDFTETGADCAFVKGPFFPSSIKKDKTLNVYVIRTEKGFNHRGYFCVEARDAKFANAFVASQATNSTILHELAHNLGLGHLPGALNVMNDSIQNGAFFSEGQIFRMNFSSNSALTLFGVHESDKLDCPNMGPPPKGCPAEESWIWPDP